MSRDWYDTHAHDYINQTRDLDLGRTRARFLSRLPAHALILDAGCGSGRDSLAFLGQGHGVVAFDGSKAMVEAARGLTGGDVRWLTFDAVDFADEFDGIWACASLVHLRGDGFQDALARLTRALKPGGVLYVSMKHGQGTENRGGRVFHLLDEAELRKRFADVEGLDLLETWQTQDVRPGRGAEGWVNGLAARSQPGT